MTDIDDKLWAVDKIRKAKEKTATISSGQNQVLDKKALNKQMVKVEDKVENALRKMMGGDFTDVRPPISDSFQDYCYGRKMTSETYKK